MAKLTACVALLSLAAGACAGGPSDSAGPRVVPLAGDVRLFQGDESFILEEESALSTGDRLVAGDAGRALVELAGGRSVELAPQAQLLMAGLEEPEVLRGSVLVRSASGLTVNAAGAQIEGESSVFRVDRQVSTTVAVYRGEASLVGSGLDPVPALREATVVSGGSVPRAPRPMTVRPDDPWDAELLGSAIDVGLDLDRLQRGLARQIPTGNPGETVIAALQDFPERPIKELLERIRAAEAVVAAAVAEHAAGQASLPLVDALDGVVDLRLQDAHWIVVVAQWGLAGTPLLSDLATIIGLIARFVTPPPSTLESGPGPAGPGGPTATGDEGTVSADTSGGGGSVVDGGGSTDAGSGGGTTSEPPPPPPSCQNQVECTVDDLVGGVIDDLGGGLPGPL